MTDAEKTLVHSIVEIAWARKLLAEMRDDLQFKNLSPDDKAGIDGEIARLEKRIKVLSGQCKTFSRIVFEAEQADEVRKRARAEARP